MGIPNPLRPLGHRATSPRSTMTGGTRLEFGAVYNVDVVCIDLGSTAGARGGGGALGAGWLAETLEPAACRSGDEDYDNIMCVWLT